MDFLRNAWYVAAWSDEIAGDALFNRRIAGERILIYRDESGAPVAMTDRCPHRFVPLHMGKRHGDVIECAYHGLRFNSSGSCVLNPCGDVIPKAAHVRTYPAVEKDRLIFIWLGDPKAADASLLPDYWFMNDPSCVHVKGYIHGDSSYLLMIDNILDLSHTNFLHADTLGSAALAKATTTVVEHANYVDVLRWMPNDIQAPISASSRGFANRLADTWLDTRWHPPGSMLIEMGMTEVNAPRSEGKVAYSLHLVTPETKTSNHYFWGSARSYSIEDDQLTHRISQGFAKAFTIEDKPVLEAQQEEIGDRDFWSMNPVLLAGDAGGMRVRRRLERMLKDEAEAARHQAEHRIAGPAA